MKLSVITATYNSEKTIVDTLNSMNEQEYQDIEHIIIDGGSSDSTLNLIKQYGHKVSIVVSEPDNGIYDALNKGISLATGDIIGFLHSDDTFFDHFVLSDIASKFYLGSFDAIYGDLNYIDRNDPNKIIRRWLSGEYAYKKLSRGWMPPHPTFYMRKTIYDRLGGFNTSLRISADYDSMLRYFCQGKIDVGYIPRVLLNMKVGGESNRSIGNMIKKSKEDLLVIKHHKIGGLITLLNKNLTKIPQFLNFK